MDWLKKILGLHTQDEKLTEITLLANRLLKDGDAINKTFNDTLRQINNKVESSLKSNSDLSEKIQNLSQYNFNYLERHR